LTDLIRREKVSTSGKRGGKERKGLEDGGQKMVSWGGRGGKLGITEK